MYQNFPAFYGIKMFDEQKVSYTNIRDEKIRQVEKFGWKNDDFSSNFDTNDHSFSLIH